jgi:organic radical activating enzyme
MKKFSTHDYTPFEFFLSPEMEEIRNKMWEDIPIEGCEKCYKMEDLVGSSPRLWRFHSDYQVLDSVKSVKLKLRIFGNNCNLSCYMCHPYNSSLRTLELKAIGIYDEIANGRHFDGRIDKDQWEEIEKDVLNNIDKIGNIHLTGGEPFLLPRHYQFIDSIPDQYKKNIEISYDTNFTLYEYKGKSIFDYLSKFKKATFSISCDHYCDKLAWIRYPIDVKQFEDNISNFLRNKPDNMKINVINVTASILNVEDLHDIKKYYKEKFGLKCTFNNVVNAPRILNIKNHPKEKELLAKYKNDPDMDMVVKNLLSPINPKEWNKGIDYLEKLDNHRNTNYRDLWDYERVELIKLVNV